MKSEERIIHASILAGWTDIILGLIFYLTGFADWYYTRFHVFGVIGMGMLAYGFWHSVLYRRGMQSEKKKSKS